MSIAEGAGCPHCHLPLFRKSETGDKLKVGRTMVVLHRGGDVEVNCPRCKGGVIVGRLEAPAALRKAQPRLHIRPRPE